MSFHRLVMLAALAGAIACSAACLAARDETRAAAVAVDNVDVEQVSELTAGVPLIFTVFGTPQSLATLRIDGGRRVLELRETDAGIYEGTYVIDGRDAIRADSRVTATLQRAGAVAHAGLDEPLLLARGSVPWNIAAADAAAHALSTPITAPTSMPMPNAVAPPEPVPPAHVFTARPAPRGNDREPCADCAIVESVRAVDAPPRGGVVGAVGGAIAGAILGKELGEAHTRRVLSVLGAIGGALLGREVARQASSSTHYDVVLRLADGTLLKRRYEQTPPFATGQTIRLGGAAGRSAPVPVSF